MRCHRCDPDPGEPVTTQFAAGYRAAFADVRREINDRWGAASFSSYRARVLEVLDKLEQRGTTATEKNDAR